MSYQIIYTEELLANVGGRCEYSAIPIFGQCTIKIRPKYKRDSGLFLHELQHYKQYRRNPLHVLMYKYCSWYRYKCELRAYEQQIIAYRYNNLDECKWIINALYLRYQLPYSREKIVKDVRGLL